MRIDSSLNAEGGWNPYMNEWSFGRSTTISGSVAILIADAVVSWKRSTQMDEFTSKALC